MSVATAIRYNTNGSWNNGEGPVASPNGTSDFFVGPEFDLRDYGAATMTFDVAFKESWADKGLNLRVWAISDCKQSFDLMFEKAQGPLETSLTPYDPYVLAWEPESCDEWRGERISLNSFAGQRVRIIFEANLEADYSQNLYIDNICVQAKKFCNVPKRVPELPGTYVASNACVDDQGWMHFTKKADAEPVTQEDLLLLSVYEPERYGVGT